MAYNPYEAVSRIFNLKGEWTDATKAGDTKRAQKAAQDATEAYERLRQSGYGGEADKLFAQDYGQAKTTRDYYAKTGNTEFRPYLYSLGTKYGLSQQDLDALVKWDDTTGEITFGGKKIGKPFSTVDGTSYFSDVSVIDNAFNDYIKRSGKTLSNTQMADQNTAEINTKINDLFGIRTQDRAVMAGKYDKLEDYNYNYNPYESDIGKSIMEDYKWQGAQASDNAAASGAASNSGNIDSFAAANASRQQAAFTNMGKAAVLSDFNTRVTNAQNILKNLGFYQQAQDAGMQSDIQMQQNESQRLFENDQTARNNQVSNDLAAAQTFGRATSNQYTNPYIGQNMDFKAAYDQAKANGASAEVLNQLAEARFMKQVSMNDFSAGFIPFEPTSRETANMLLTNKQIDSAERISGSTLDSNERLTNAQIASAERIASGTNQSAIDQIKAQTEGQKELLAEQAKHSTTGENTTLPADFKPRLTAAQSREAIEGGNITQSTVNDYNYWHGTNYTVDTINKGSEIEDSADGNKQQQVKDIIYSIPSDGSNAIYYPIQEIARNRIVFERETNSDFINGLIVEEGKKILREEGRKIGKWELEKILRREGFSDAKELSKLLS